MKRAGLVNLLSSIHHTAPREVLSWWVCVPLIGAFSAAIWALIILLIMVLR